MIPPFSTILTHEDGTVSVGISRSGKRHQNIATDLQMELDFRYGKGQYRVSLDTLDETDGIVLNHVVL